MIVTCECGAKLKISDDKLTEAGVKIRCPKCGASHLIRKSATSAEEPAGMRAQPPLKMPAEAGAPQAAASSPLVLVAHDSSVVADMIRNVLQKAGMAVEHAIDGLSALKKATELRPRVMIVDVGLTGIYGFELCERLKEDPQTRDIKIILLSSVYGLTAYKRNPVTLYGADDYIEKHHIPDRLVPKLTRLLTGEAPEVPSAPLSAQGPASAAQPVRTFEPEPRTPAPLIRNRGIEMVEAGAPVPAGVLKAEDPSAAAVDQPSERSRAAGPSARTAERGFDIPDVPDVLPKVPVTLDAGRKRPSAPLPQPSVVQQQAREEVIAEPAPRNRTGEISAQRDGSVSLDASFFEQEEYAAPAKPAAKAVADPVEIEKARKFARLIVSDVVLYNQEAVIEGLGNGTFYELLRDDITEGRALYEKRVPEAIRATKDYYQEAFDNFIAAQKNQR